MAVNEQLLYWLGASNEVTTVFGQDIQVDVNDNPEDPIGGLHIHAAGFAGTPLFLPNSTPQSPTWTQIPGTSPSIEVRQDGYWPLGTMRVRMPNPFLNVTNLNANATLGAVAAATRIEECGDVARFRGSLQATVLITANTVLGRVAHPPLHAVSTGARYSGGSNRLQINTLGDLTFAVTLNPGEQLWLDSTTYDLLP